VRRAEENADEMVGQDSFLDVVTNIVGILILLVMVVGMRSSKAGATAVSSTVTQIAIPQEDQLREAYETAMMDERDVRELVHRTYNTNGDTMLREQERQWLAEAVAEAKQVIETRRAKLSSNDQRDFDLRRQIAEAQLKLETLTREQVALLAAETEDEQIKCEPTPIARLVRGKEIRVQLANDYVAILPFDELLEQMDADLAQNAWRLKNDDELIRTVGPLDGFRLQYRFEVKDVVVTTRNGATTSGRKPVYIGSVFLPERASLGEPALHAMQPGMIAKGRRKQNVTNGPYILILE
jgi:hypothetical protein